MQHMADHYGLNFVSTTMPTTIRGTYIDLAFANVNEIQPLLRQPLTVHFTDHKAIILKCNKELGGGQCR